MKQNDQSYTLLRQDAEARIARTPTSEPTLKLLPADELLHELRVHQIELETQNEDLRLTLATLEAARARYADLYDFAPVGYITLTRKELMAEINLSAIALLDEEPNRLQLRRFSQFVAHEDRDRWYRHFLHTLQHDGKQRCEVALARRDGSAMHVQLDCQRVGSDAENSSVRIALTDITERKQAEQAIRQAKEAAEAASLAKTQFLSNMSHELRTPLHAMIGFSDLLLTDDEQPLSEQHRAHVQMISDAANHQLAMVKDIFDFSKIDSGKIDLNMAAVPLDALFRECVAMSWAVANKMGVLLALPDSVTPLQVLADKVRLRQVLINLLSNGIKYNRAGGQVTIFADHLPAGSKIRISIQDTGVGIPQEKLGELFRPFSRLGYDNSGIEGTGSVWRSARAWWKPCMARSAWKACPGPVLPSGSIFHGRFHRRYAGCICPFRVERMKLTGA